MRPVKEGYSIKTLLSVSKGWNAIRIEIMEYKDNNVLIARLLKKQFCEIN
jgi:hypothetical protein